MKKQATAICVMCALMLVGCGKNKKYENLRDKPIPVEIEVVGQNGREVVNTYVGEMKAKASIHLIFPAGGQLTSLLVRSGQQVREGELLATTDNTQALSMYESAEAMYRQAQDGYDRVKPVHEKGGISDVKWVDLETSLQKARSMYISSRKRLEDCSLKAPKAGIVNLNQVEVGQHLTPGQPIGTLLDMDGREVTFTVPESEIGTVAIGQIVEVNVQALNRDVKGRVTEKSYISTQLAHTYKVTAVLEGGQQIDDLLPGMVCRVVMTKAGAGGFVISSGCVQTQQRGQSVWVLRNGRTQRVMIEIADFVENGVLVSEGLQEGDTIISKGYQKMYEGARVSW